MPKQCKTLKEYMTSMIKKRCIHQTLIKEDQTLNRKVGEIVPKSASVS